MDSSIDQAKYDAYHAEQEVKLWQARREQPITPTEAFISRDDKEDDFINKVKKISKYYNSTILIEKENTFKSKDLTNLFLETKKRKITTINNKTITYTHCIPSSIDLIKFTWKQRLKILLGIKVNVTINTYLNDGKIEATILKINN